MSSFAIALQMWWPIAAALGLLLLSILVRSRRKETTVTITFLGLIEIPLNIKAFILIRLVLVVSSAILFMFPAFRDYSNVFPSHYDLKVYFDDEGIDQLLANMSIADKRSLRIISDWRGHKSKYLEDLSGELKAKIGGDFAFASSTGWAHGDGEARFEVTNTGWQEYEIAAATGSLSHTLEVPNGESIILHSKFQLLETNRNYISLSLCDIYWRWNKMLTPEFKQSIEITPEHELYNHNVMAVTRVRFFPIIDVGNTLYLVEDDNHQRFPIAYAINIAE